MANGGEDGKLIGGVPWTTICGMWGWSVSSCKVGNGISALRDDLLAPHSVNIQFQKKVKLQLVVMYLDFKQDESYTPSKITIRAGDGFHNLKDIKAVELVHPAGWVYIPLSPK